MDRALIWIEDAVEVAAVMVVRSVHPFPLAFWYCSHLDLAVIKKGLVGELGLVLELDPVPYLVVSHCVLQDHDFEYLYGLGVSEFTLGDEGRDMGTQGMDTLIRELADIRE